jgi:hypothetical protein
MSAERHENDSENNDRRNGNPSMSESNPSLPDTTERINHDGRVFGENGEPDYFIPGDFIPKLFFVILAFAMPGVGIWLLWDPTVRLFFGETTEARVSRIVQSEPGKPDEIIRLKRPIEAEQSNFNLTFAHYVEVPLDDGTVKEYRIGVDARTEPHFLVNDSFDVIFFPEENVAYGLFHHRTWAFGFGFLLMGLTFVPLSLYLLYMVGKPVYIDPEDPEELEKERLAVERENA